MRRTDERRRALFGYSRNVYLMLLFTLGKGLQISIATLTTNLYLFSLGYRQEFIGLITAIPAIGAFVAAVPIGLIADRWGRKPLLIWSGLLNPLALAGIALSTNAPLLIIASLANGLLSGGYWVTNLPLLTESTSDDQRVGVLALNSFLLLGVGAVGSLIGGFVPEVAGSLLGLSASSVVPLRLGVLASAIVVLLPALPLFWLADGDPARERELAEAVAAGVPASVPEQAVPVGAALAVEPVGARERVHSGPGADPADPADPVGRAATVALFLKLLLPDVLFTTGQGAVVGLLQIYLKLRFHLEPGPLGVLFTVAGLTGGVTSLLSPRLVRRWGSLRTAVLMQYLTVPAVLVTGFAPGVVVAAGGEFARNVLRGCFDPVYSAFAMQSVSRRLRGTLSGFYSTTWSIGFTIGPGLAGILQQRVNLSASFILGAACIALSATLLTAFFGRGTGAGRRQAMAPAAR